MSLDPNAAKSIGRVATQDSNGVPTRFTKASSNGRDYFITKGTLTKLKTRPAIFNEHCESSNEVQAMVDATTIVGQVFKASRDNINGLSLTLESNEAVVFDNFNVATYADNTALQLVWEEDTNAAVVDIVNFYEGDQSMKLNMNTAADECIRTITAADFTGSSGTLHFMQDVAFSSGKIAAFIGDGTNTRSQLLAINTVDQWTTFQVQFDDMIEDQPGTTDIENITKVGFRVVDKAQGKFAWVDFMTSTPAPGKVNLKLFCFGATLPEGMRIDSGVQYTNIGDLGLGIDLVSSLDVPMTGGKKLYSIRDFICGTALEYPSNELITDDYYYALTINYVDTEVNVYGPNTALLNNYYQNGYAFTAPDEATVVTPIGPYSDIMFVIYSTQDVYITQYLQVMDAAPGFNARTNVFVEDENMGIVSMLTVGTIPQQIVNADLGSTPFFLPKGGKFEQYYNDQFDDSVSQINMQIGYKYEPLHIHG